MNVLSFIRRLARARFQDVYLDVIPILSSLVATLNLLKTVEEAWKNHCSEFKKEAVSKPLLIPTKQTNVDLFGTCF